MKKKSLPYVLYWVVKLRKKPEKSPAGRTNDLEK